MSLHVAERDTDSFGAPGLLFPDLLFLRLFPFFRSAKPPLSPPFHPHSERFSLGASWVFSIQ